MTARDNIPTENEVLAYYTTLSNWGRWGPDDERGTLNLITAAKRLQAARLVRRGCCRLLRADLDLGSRA